MQPANVLHIASLGTNWCDKDEVMLHACFQLLRDAIEVEKIFESAVDWDYDDKHRTAKAELLELYAWWQARCRSAAMDAAFLDQEAQDDAMLARLIKCRWALWI
jgi:hypothetical protein